MSLLHPTILATKTPEYPPMSGDEVKEAERIYHLRFHHPSGDNNTYVLTPEDEVLLDCLFEHYYTQYLNYQVTADKIKEAMHNICDYVINKKDPFIP